MYSLAGLGLKVPRSKENTHPLGPPWDPRHGATVPPVKLKPPYLVYGREAFDREASV